MDYLEVGNDSHLVVGSGEAKMGGHSSSGLVELLQQVSKALHRRTAEELEGIRLKPFLALAHVRERGTSSQQELESPPRSRTCATARNRSEQHTSELQAPDHLVCRLLLETSNSWSGPL